MKPNLVAAALAGAALSLSGAVFAQSNADPSSKPQTGPGASFTHGESKRCESMSGSAKEDCDRQEATKTDGSQAASGGSETAAGSSQPSGDKPFTHGESKRCEKLTGAAKAECDKQEATK